MKIDEKLNKTKLMLWARVGKRAPSWGAKVLNKYSDDFIKIWAPKDKMLIHLYQKL